MLRSKNAALIKLQPVCIEWSIIETLSKLSTVAIAQDAQTTEHNLTPSFRLLFQVWY